MAQLSRSRKNSLNSPLIQARKRLLSLKVLNPSFADSRNAIMKDQQIFSILQKSLAKHNLQDQNISDLSPILPNQEQNIVEDRIWNQFIKLDSRVSSKIERQRINYYEKFFIQTKKEYQGYQSARKKCIQGLDGTIKQKYKQIHSYFEEIKQQKSNCTMFNVTAKTSKKNKKNQIPVMDNQGKIQTLKSTIQDLRKEVTEIQKQKQALLDEQKKLYNNWVYFLKKYLKNGYYLKKGVTPILRELYQIKSKVTLDDISKCLDDISKRCLLQQFNSFKNENTIRIKKRINSESQSKISNLAKKQMIRDVYNGTKEYIINLVKQSSWNEPLTLPPIKQTKILKQMSWHQNQKKRIVHAYFGQEYERARSILFGPKVQPTS